MRRISIALIFLIVFGVASAHACATPTTSLEAMKQSFRIMMEKADHVFLGDVSHIVRRRWSDDDIRPNLHSEYLELAEKRKNGEDIGEFDYLANYAEYSEATAYLSVFAQLVETGLVNRETELYRRTLVPVDLLQPYSVAGHGPCENFPRTCPWDIKPGDRLVLAIQEKQFGSQVALVCIKAPTMSDDQLRRIKRKSGFTTKYDAIQPFLPWEQRNYSK